MDKSSVYLETSSSVTWQRGPAGTCLQLLASRSQPSGGKTGGIGMLYSRLNWSLPKLRAGDAQAAQRRLELLREVPELKITEEVRRLAGALIAQDALPAKAQADALHIAVAAVHHVDYLLTWNCRHIDNPATKPIVRTVCILEGYSCPEICTPIEIMEIGENKG